MTRCNRFEEGEAVQRVEALLRDAAAYEPETEAPTGFETRALAALSAAAPRRRSLGTLVAVGLLGGAVAASAVVVVGRTSPAPSPPVATAKLAPPVVVAQTRSQLGAEHGHLLKALPDVPAPRSRRIRTWRVTSAARSYRKPGARGRTLARPPSVKWEIEVVRHEVVGMVTPELHLTPGDIPGEWVVTPTLLNTPLGQRTTREGEGATCGETTPLPRPADRKEGE